MDRTKAVMQQNLRFLSKKVRDKVTGFEGVGTTVAIDLYGCVQTLVSPPALNGKKEEGHWFDNNRLEALDQALILPMPDSIAPVFEDETTDIAVDVAPTRAFREKGPESRPAMSFAPIPR